MYEYSEITGLLSAAVVKLLSDSELYADIQGAADSIVFAEIGNTDKTDATLQPYAWIVEYVASQKLANISEEKRRYDKNNFDTALHLLSKQTKVTGSDVGTIDNIYEN